MFSWSRRLLPAQVLKGCAALLALVLSAFGGSRLGVERLPTGGDRPDQRAVVRAATVVAAIAAPAAIERDQAEPDDAPRSLVPAAPAATVRAPALLLGSALGPRAP